MTSEAESGRYMAARTGVIVRRRGRIARLFRRLAAQRDRGTVRYAALCEAIAEAETPFAIVAALESGLPALVPCDRIALELNGEEISSRLSALPVTGAQSDMGGMPAITVPLRHGSSVPGVLRVSGPFSDRERMLLHSLGGMIGAAVVSTRYLQHLETTITYLEQRNSELEALSTADALTGIPNRRISRTSTTATVISRATSAFVSSQRFSRRQSGARETSLRGSAVRSSASFCRTRLRTRRNGWRTICASACDSSASATQVPATPRISP
jgi:hypothetical protein